MPRCLIRRCISLVYCSNSSATIFPATLCLSCTVLYCGSIGISIPLSQNPPLMRSGFCDSDYKKRNYRAAAALKRHGRHVFWFLRVLTYLLPHAHTCTGTFKGRSYQCTIRLPFFFIGNASMGMKNAPVRSDASIISYLYYLSNNGTVTTYRICVILFVEKPYVTSSF